MTLLPKVFDITEEELATAVPGYCYRLPEEKITNEFWLIRGERVRCLFRLVARVYFPGKALLTSDWQVRADGCVIGKQYTVPVPAFGLNMDLPVEQLQAACNDLIAQSSPDIHWRRAAPDEYLTNFPYRGPAPEPVAA